MTGGEEKSQVSEISARPWKPRPVLFFSLLAATLLWIAALVAMYLKTRPTGK